MRSSWYLKMDKTPVTPFQNDGVYGKIEFIIVVAFW